MPYIGDGDVCGLDTDGDGCPDENLGCNEPFCFEVRDFLLHYMYVFTINYCLCTYIHMYIASIIIMTEFIYFVARSCFCD